MLTQYVHSYDQEATKVVVKRSNSQLRHKGESKPRASGGRQAGAEYFETIDSGWTSRDSSSMDRWD